MILILKIKKSFRDNSWIVYNPHNFQLHTHCRSRRVAIVIRDNVNGHRMPKTRDLRMLYSHIRVTRNRQYIRLLEERIHEIMNSKSAAMKTPA